MYKRLAIITTHPIQYYAPLFKLLSVRGIIEFCVFYTWGVQGSRAKYDPDFNKIIEWDIPLLEGYRSIFLENISKEPGSHHYNGIINPDIISQIDEYSPDAILVVGWAFRSHLAVLRHYKNKIPVFFRGDSTLLDKTSWYKSVIKKVFLRWVYSHIDKALYVGKSNFDYFVEYGLTCEQLVFAPHAVDNKRFSCESENCISNGQTIRRKLQIDQSDFVVLFAGKFEPKKDPEILLDSFVEADLPKHIHLVFVGDGVLIDLLKTKGQSNTNIHFLPFQNQLMMPSVYHMANVLVLPSLGPQETWGLCVNEAMACGKAVIASNKCGCAADLVRENNGFTFEAGNKNQLIKHLKWLAQNSNEVKKMGQNSKQIIQQYNYQNIAEAIENL